MVSFLAQIFFIGFFPVSTFSINIVGHRRLLRDRSLGRAGRTSRHIFAVGSAATFHRATWPVYDIFGIRLRERIRISSKAWNGFDATGYVLLSVIWGLIAVDAGMKLIDQLWPAHH
jgi:hypothetical protein